MASVQDPTNPPNQALIHDLVNWIATQPRAYTEVMEAWRTSCPRLTIWEDATDLGYLECFNKDGVAMVRATAQGIAFNTNCSSNQFQ